MTEEAKRGIHPYKIEIFPSGKTLPASALAFYRRSNAALIDKHTSHVQEWADHIKSSRDFITQTAIDSRSRALLFGVENATDIPLEALAEQFDQLTLVEVDQDSVVAAVEALPIKSQEKVKIIIDDLTGALGGMTAQLEQVVQTGSFMRFLNQADSVVKKHHPTDFKIDDGYSFVCSSLVLTQFASQLYDQMRLMVAQAYAGSEIRPETGGLSLLVDLTAFAKECQEKHLNLLRRSVASNGRIYLADTFSEVYLACDPLTQQVYPTSQPMEMFDTGLLAQQLLDRFTLNQEKGWVWYRERPPKAISQPTKGSVFQVRAFSLNPR